LFLQYFQWEDGSAGRNWILKATCHLHRLRWLLQVFPDATIVHCHRNPVTSLTSLTDMFYEVRKIGSDRDDPLEVGRFTLNYSCWQIAQYLEQRAMLERKHRFVDVDFKDIVAKPFDVIEKIYRAAKVELTDDARAAMRQWEQANPQHKFGKRDYRLEKFGYSEGGLRRDFANYMERFAQFM
jgi:Sulfotransferase family